MKKVLLFGISLIIAISNLFAQDDILAKGNEYLNSKEYKKAEKKFKEGIKAQPENLIYQCQLGLTQIEQEQYNDAQKTLQKVIDKDSNNMAAIWYSGIGYFYSKDDGKAIEKFEKALTLLDENSGQYFSANWFIGKCYSSLLRTEGLSYDEVDRMFECYEEYLGLQPNANDAKEILEYIERKKKRRPSKNVKKWVDL